MTNKITVRVPCYKDKPLSLDKWAYYKKDAWKQILWVHLGTERELAAKGFSVKQFELTPVTKKER